MAEDKREGWLADLKVGEKVGYGYYHFGRTVAGVGTISKITPTGRLELTVNGGKTQTYNFAGRQMGGDDNRLLPLDEARAYDRRNRAHGALQEAVDALVVAHRQVPLGLAPEAADEIRALVERATALLQSART